MIDILGPVTAAAHGGSIPTTIEATTSTSSCSAATRSDSAGSTSRCSDRALIAHCFESVATTRGTSRDQLSGGFSRRDFAGRSTRVIHIDRTAKSRAATQARVGEFAQSWVAAPAKPKSAHPE